MYNRGTNPGSALLFYLQGKRETIYQFSICPVHLVQFLKLAEIFKNSHYETPWANVASLIPVWKSYLFLVVWRLSLGKAFLSLIMRVSCEKQKPRTK